MILTIKLKLLPDKSQAQSLLETMRTVNAVRQEISQIAFDKKIYNKMKLQADCYHDLKAKHNISAQSLILSCCSVVSGYKSQHGSKTLQKYRPLAAIPYDRRNLSFKPDEQTASLWSVDGRLKGIPYKAAESDKRWITKEPKESKLLCSGNKFYLLVAYDLPEDNVIEVTDFVGVDLGITNIATTSDSDIASSDELNRIRSKYENTKARCQSKGTKSSKRVLRKQSGKQVRFTRDLNHRISKNIVSNAKDTGRAIVLEDLKGIRSRTVYGPLKKQLGSWAFADLRSKIEYKAKLSGIPIVIVPPAYTSQTCFSCGYCVKENRAAQEKFECISCGYTDHGDINAAKVIANWGAVNHPDGSTRDFSCELGPNHLSLSRW